VTESVVKTSQLCFHSRGFDLSQVRLLREREEVKSRSLLKLTVLLVLTACFTSFRSDKEEQDAEVEPSVLGLQSHWDSTYADELVNFHEQGDAGEIWLAT
jgi:hypothetical protein